MTGARPPPARCLLRINIMTSSHCCSAANLCHKPSTRSPQVGPSATMGGGSGRPARLFLSSQTPAPIAAVGESDLWPAQRCVAPSRANRLAVDRARLAAAKKWGEGERAARVPQWGSGRGAPIMAPSHNFTWRCVTPPASTRGTGITQSTSDSPGAGSLSSGGDPAVNAWGAGLLGSRPMGCPGNRTDVLLEP